RARCSRTAPRPSRSGSSRTTWSWSKPSRSPRPASSTRRRSARTWRRRATSCRICAAASAEEPRQTALPEEVGGARVLRPQRLRNQARDRERAGIVEVPVVVAEELARRARGGRAHVAARDRAQAELLIERRARRVEIDHRHAELLAGLARRRRVA